MHSEATARPRTCPGPLDDPDPCRAYARLRRHRRALGDERYGARHLSRTDLARDRIREAADAVVYLTLHRIVLRTGAPVRPEDLGRLERLIREAGRLGALCASVEHPTGAPGAFAEMLADRLAYGERNHGDEYRGRDNLAEALEEICDCDVLVDLDRERYERMTGEGHPAPLALSLISDRCASLAEGVLALRARLREGAGTAEPAARPRAHLSLVDRAADVLRAGREREARSAPGAPDRHTATG